MRGDEDGEAQGLVRGCAQTVSGQERSRGEDQKLKDERERVRGERECEHGDHGVENGVDAWLRSGSDFWAETAVILRLWYGVLGELPGDLQCVGWGSGIWRLRVW